MVGNWYLVVHPLNQGPLRSLWSISVEEQFYLAWPTLTKFGGMHGIWRFSLGLLPLSLVAVFLASTFQHYLYATVWLNSIVQFQFFALGALLAIRFSGKAPNLSPRIRIFFLLAGVGLWLTASGACGIKRAGLTPIPVVMCLGYALVAVGSVLIFLSVLGYRARALPAFLVYLGKISYGLYVFHECGFLIAGFLGKKLSFFLGGQGVISSPTFIAIIERSGALAVTIVFAMLSYRYLESPFLQLKKKFTFVQSRSV